MQINTILVPVDFSDDASAALDYAIELAQDFNAEIHLIHAYQTMVAAAAPYGVSVPIALNEDLRKAAAASLAEWNERVVKAGLTVATHLSPDTPSSAIVAAATTMGVDLIVMGTRGLTGLRHVIVGSVAERTVRTAPCPVLTVKASE